MADKISYQSPLSLECVKIKEVMAFNNLEFPFAIKIMISVNNGKVKYPNFVNCPILMMQQVIK